MVLIEKYLGDTGDNTLSQKELESRGFPGFDILWRRRYVSQRGRRVGHREGMSRTAWGHDFQKWTDHGLDLSLTYC